MTPALGSGGSREGPWARDSGKARAPASAAFEV